MDSICTETITFQSLQEHAPLLQQLQEHEIQHLFSYYCTHDRVELAKYLLHLYPSLYVTTPFSQVLQICILHHHINTLQWILSIKPFLTLQTIDTLNLLCEHERFEEISFYFPTFSEFVNTHAFEVRQLLCQACDHGQSQILFYFEKICPSLFTNSENEKNGIHSFIINSIYKRHFDLAEWLLKKSQVSLLKSFVFLSCFPHIDLLEWILQMEPTLCHTTEYYNAFYNACVNNHISVAAWLYDKQPNIPFHFNDDQLFRETCRERNLQIAKWLYFLCPNINLSACQDDAFVSACIQGDIQLALWIASCVNQQNNCSKKYIIHSRTGQSFKYTIETRCVMCAREISPSEPSYQNNYNVTCNTCKHQQVNGMIDVCFGKLTLK
jgi:hypothetical protein